MSKFVAVACPEIEIRVANRRKAVGEDPASVNWRDPGNFCYTQLHKAVAAHDLPAIRCLIEQQHANVNVKDSDHNTPVTLAFLLGFNEAVEYLSAA